MAGKRPETVCFFVNKLSSRYLEPSGYFWDAKFCHPWLFAFCSFDHFPGFQVLINISNFPHSDRFILISLFVLWLSNKLSYWHILNWWLPRGTPRWHLFIHVLQADSPHFWQCLCFILFYDFFSCLICLCKKFYSYA